MRCAVMVVLILLVAGCSPSDVERSMTSAPTAATPPPDATTTPGGLDAAPPPATPSDTSGVAATPAPAVSPRPGAALADVIAWIDAGHAVAAGSYRVPAGDDARTGVGSPAASEVAFTVGVGQPSPVTCVTDSGVLSCLVDLVDPPSQPGGVYGDWKGNWVDFDGATVQVGSAHGDPGPFSRGDGPQLPDRAVISFGDYRCRTDGDEVLCLNDVHRSAVRLGPAGVEPFGCLHRAPAPEGVGRLLSCAT